MKLIIVFFFMVVSAYGKTPLQCDYLKTRAKIIAEDKDDNISRIYDFSVALEKLINQQIKTELGAFYAYLSMSHFFQRDDYYMEGFAKYFHAAAMEEFKHAEMFMKYQAKRGGRVNLFDITKPEEQSWDSAYAVFKAAIHLEKNVTTELRCLSQFANDEYFDIDFAQFLDGEIIPEQYSSMKELMNHMSTLQRTSTVKHKSVSNEGIAELLLDNRCKSQEQE